MQSKSARRNPRARKRKRASPRTSDQPGDSEEQDEQGEQGEPTDSDDSGKSNEKKPIDVEPGDHIEEDMEEFKYKNKQGCDNRSSVGKPVVYDFYFD
jgi:hypothetical protein